jgi:hypothetical protein
LQPGNAEMFDHGIITGIEFFPSMVEQIGWWYKVVFYYSAIPDQYSYNKYGKIIFNVEEISDIQELEVFEEDLIVDQIEIDASEILEVVIEGRIDFYSSYIKGKKSN